MPRDSFIANRFRDSRARATFLYCNLSENIFFSDFTAKITNDIPNLRSDFPPMNEDAENGKKSSYPLVPPESVLMHVGTFEFFIPFLKPPQLEVKFTLKNAEDESSATHRKYIIPLPLCLSNFMSPIPLSPDEFNERWGAMSDSEAVQEGPCKKSMDTSNYDSVHVSDSLFCVASWM